MPAPKGCYNARQYHEEAAQEVEASLRRVLDSLGSGTVFRNVSALAEHVAAACGQTAGNLRRNRRYRLLLEHHIARQPGTVGLLGDDTRLVAVLRAKLLEANLRATNLERDRKRLEAFAARHLPNATAIPFAGPSSRQPAAEPEPDLHHAFECTATALEIVIKYVEILGIDRVTNALVDRSARPGSPPVVGPHLMQDFVRWRRRRK